MLAPSPMPIGPAPGMVRGMESAMAMAQGIGAIRSAIMVSPMGRRDSDGMADMEVSARHVRRLVRRAPGPPYLQIRPRALEKTTEWLAQSTWRDLFLILIGEVEQ